VAEPGALERPHVRLKLIRELATGEKSNRALAKDFDVTAQAVDAFKKRHAARIAEVAARLDDEFAGLWIAQKAARIETLQSQVEHIADLLEPQTEEQAKAADEEYVRQRMAGVNVSTAELMRTAQSALRAVSEELGQLPARTVRHEGGVSVRYEVAGVDLEALK
jgi:hypothetical protein